MICVNLDVQELINCVLPVTVRVREQIERRSAVTIG